MADIPREILESIVDKNKVYGVYDNTGNFVKILPERLLNILGEISTEAIKQDYDRHVKMNYFDDAKFGDTFMPLNDGTKRVKALENYFELCAKIFNEIKESKN